MSLVTDVKSCLINLRANDWEPLFEDVKTFCNENDILVPNMDEAVSRWADQEKGGEITSLKIIFSVLIHSMQL